MQKPVCPPSIHRSSDSEDIMHKTKLTLNTTREGEALKKNPPRIWPSILNLSQRSWSCTSPILRTSLPRVLLPLNPIPQRDARQIEGRPRPTCGVTAISRVCLSEKMYGITNHKSGVINVWNQTPLFQNTSRKFILKPTVFFTIAWCNLIYY